MDFSIFAQAPYAIMAVVCALLTGLGVGWIIWGGEDSGDEALERIRNRAQTQKPASDVSRVSGKLGDSGVLDRLEKEIREAKATLDTISQERQAFSKDIDDLDTAIKRANGRLTAS